MTHSVSVVIPARNEERFLGPCLRSLQADSSYPIAEVIVVDNRSTDSTVAIAESFAVHVIRMTEGTIAAQRNRGAAIAVGSVIAFLDADCTVEPGWAAAAIRHFDDEQVVSVGSPPGLPDEGTTWLQRGWSFLQEKPRAKAMPVSWIASCNLWVRKSAFVQVDGFDESFETCEDTDLGFRLHALGILLSDPAIRVQHHREPRTLAAFYRKEVWHGKNSFDGIAKGRITPEELPSIIAPMVFCLAAWLTLAGLAVGAFVGSYRLLGLGLLGLISVPTAYTLRAVIRKGQLLKFPVFLLIYFTYFAARSDSMLRWIFQCAFGKSIRR